MKIINATQQKHCDSAEHIPNQRHIKNNNANSDFLNKKNKKHKKYKNDIPKSILNKFLLKIRTKPEY